MENENIVSDGEEVLNTQQLARLIIDVIEDMKGESILLLDMRPVTIITDFFVICTSDNERQAKAIANNISERIKKQHQIRPMRVEGDPSSGWLLMDYVDVVVHIFSEEMREYYNLEELWKDGKVLLRIQ